MEHPFSWVNFKNHCRVYWNWLCCLSDIWHGKSTYLDPIVCQVLMLCHVCKSFSFLNKVPHTHKYCMIFCSAVLMRPHVVWRVTRMNRVQHGEAPYCPYIELCCTLIIVYTQMVGMCFGKRFYRMIEPFCNADSSMPATRHYQQKGSMMR